MCQGTMWISHRQVAKPEESSRLVPSLLISKTGLSLCQATTHIRMKSRRNTENDDKNTNSCHATLQRLRKQHTSRASRAVSRATASQNSAEVPHRRPSPALLTTCCSAPRRATLPRPHAPSLPALRQLQKGTNQHVLLLLLLLSHPHHKAATRRVWT